MAATQYPLDPAKLRQRRLLLAKSQTEVAYLVPMSPAHYNRIENGRRHPSYNMAVRIARVLGCEPIDLAEDDVQSQVRNPYPETTSTPALTLVPGGIIEVEYDPETWDDAQRAWPVLSEALTG